MWKWSALLAAWSGALGCYNYVPTAVDVAPPGDEVRLRVTHDGARQLAEVTDVMGAAPQVLGEVVGRDRADLLVSVAVARRQDGIHTSAISQTVRIPTGEILSLERREFDGPRTAMAVSGAVALGTWVMLGIVEAFGRIGRDGTDPDPDFFLSLFSIPIG